MNHILIIDDYQANLTLYAKVMSQIAETTTVPFTVPLEALAWAELNEPALVIVDQNMPEPNGLEFIRRYRALPGRRDTPIIMITGTQDRDVRREALRRGASAFLNKPVDPIEFLSYANNFLETRAIRVALAFRADQADQRTIEALVRALEARDPEFGRHAARVGRVAGLIARHAGLDAHEAAILGLAARVHDIGKLSLPERVLSSASPLTEEERALARGHVRAAMNVLGDGTSRLLTLAAELALTHHEHVDGSGYPAGLRGDTIPLGGRIVAIADSFAAMIAPRPWRPERSMLAAREEIARGAGTRYDPHLVAAFDAALPEIEAELARVSAAS